MNLILSIRPHHAKAILDGLKKYEFRKSIFKNRDIGTVYIYTTRPIQRIEGLFTIGSIHEGRPKILWERFGEYSGLEEKSFFEYFRGANKGFAIGIEAPRRFRTPINPKERIPGFHPPQNFCYISDRLHESRNEGKPS